jgi:hypothetical protein
MDRERAGDGNKEKWKKRGREEGGVGGRDAPFFKIPNFQISKLQKNPNCQKSQIQNFKIQADITQRVRSADCQACFACRAPPRRGVFFESGESSPRQQA